MAEELSHSQGNCVLMQLCEALSGQSCKGKAINCLALKRLIVSQWLTVLFYQIELFDILHSHAIESVGPE